MLPGLNNAIVTFNNNCYCSETEVGKEEFREFIKGVTGKEMFKLE